jgi:Skp family chaperone for outer membrane proteins
MHQFTEKPMRRHLLVLYTLVLLGIYLLTHPEPAKTSTANATPASTAAKLPDRVKVALVDVASIFKRHTAFKTKMDKMKEKVNAAEAKVAESKKQMDKLAEQQKDPTLTAEERGEVERKLRRLQGLTGAEVNMQKADLMEEEGKLYFDTYSQVKNTIDRCCEKHGIQLVLRINNDPVDPAKREDILRAINSPLPHFDSALDITEEILAEVNGEESASR